jgi:hypothetical protein
MLRPPLALPSTLDNFHGRFLVALAIRRQAKVPINNHEFELLGRHLFKTALVEQSIGSELPLTASSTHLGYLKGMLDETAVFIPWYLADVFPGGTLARELKQLALRLHVDPEGSICLSGSAVFRGALSIIGDIDFCEYAMSSPSNIPMLIGQMLQRNNDAPLVRIYLPGKRPKVDFFAPWNDTIEELSSRYENETAENAPILMLEHLVSQGALGLLPCTNRLLPVEQSNPAVGHGKTTFVFQEAVFVSGDSPPRSLVAPLELADYVAWLRDEIRSDTDPGSSEKLNSVKRLKRALSLARLIHLHEIAREILAALSDPLIERYVRHKTARELDRLIEFLPHEQREVWRIQAESRYPTDKLGKAEQREIDAMVKYVVNRVEDTYDYIADQILRVSE